MKNFNWQIVGHENIKKYLQRNITKEKLSHAYIFSGKEHLGKELVAQRFVASILCNDYHRKNNQESEFSPCGKCVFCDQLRKSIHPDYCYLQKEEGKKNISIEQVREVQKILYMASFLNSYKITVVSNAEELSESAQNALLKILEEPKKKTIIILLTRDYNLLLPTIISRCQLIKFVPVSRDIIYNHLLELGANREQAKLFSYLANGQIGQAIKFYKDPEAFKNYIDKTSQYLSLFDNNLVQRFKILDSIFQNSSNSNFSQEADRLELILRDILIVKNTSDYLITNLHFKDKIEKLSVKYSNNKLLDLIHKTKQIKFYLNNNINPRLTIENLILNF